jgi:hypothetical protein
MRSLRPPQFLAGSQGPYLAYFLAFQSFHSKSNFNMANSQGKKCGEDSGVGDLKKVSDYSDDTSGAFGFLDLK